MKKCIIPFFLFLIISFPLHSTASSEKSFDQIIKLAHKKDYVSAQKLLANFIIDNHEDIWHFRALYLKGNISIKLSKLKEAVNNFSKLLAQYTQLEDYILLKLAEAYIELGEENKAFELLNLLLNKFPESRLYPYGKFLLGKLYFNRGDLDNAYKFFTEIINQYPKSNLVPESMFFVGLILEKQNKIMNAYETYVKLFHSFPLNEFAMEAKKKISEMRKKKPNLQEFSPELILKRIELLMKAGEYSRVSRECKKYLKIFKKGPFYQNLTLNLAQTYLFIKKRDEALKIYKSLSAKYPSGSFTAEALYNIATIYWNQGKYGKALEYCKKVINKFPSSPFAIRAFYVSGRILEQNKKYHKAISQFKRMVKKYPHGSYSVNAHWRIGWINYIIGNYPIAAEKFSKTASIFPESSIIDMFLYWAGKSNEKMGETNTAYSFYERVAKEYPYNYYGHRAKTRLSKKSGNKVKMIDPFLQRDLENIAVYSGVEIKMHAKDRFHYVRIKELITLGFYKDALEEVRLIARNVSINTPGKILRVGNLYLQAEGYFNTLEIMEGFLNELPYKKRLHLSLDYWKHFFPLAYLELVVNYARDFKLDPFLIEGLMRQESAFDPDSLSRSGAIGLMQLMPETGESEYKKKYKSKFYLEALYSPEMNISLGSQHLAHLFKKTNGDSILALAAYNAGLSRALKWKKTIKTSDPDVFVEMIPFRETKWYIKKVLRNYFNYITLYGDGEKEDKILALNEKDL